MGLLLACLLRNRAELFVVILGKKKVRLKGEVVWVLEDVLGMCSGNFVDRDSSELIESAIFVYQLPLHMSCLERKSTYDKRNTEENKVYL